MTDDYCTNLAATFQEPEDLPHVDVTTDHHKPSMKQDKRLVEKEERLLEVSLQVPGSGTGISTPQF